MDGTVEKSYVVAVTLSHFLHAIVKIFNEKQRKKCAFLLKSASVHLIPVWNQKYNRAKLVSNFLTRPSHPFRQMG